MFSLSRLWAEVFHVTTSGSGTVKWQQVSEDLVPVNIACVADDPQLVFHITAYNSQAGDINSSHTQLCTVGRLLASNVNGRSLRWTRYWT